MEDKNTWFCVVSDFTFEDDRILFLELNILCRISVLVRIKISIFWYSVLGN